MLARAYAVRVTSLVIARSLSMSSRPAQSRPRCWPTPARSATPPKLPPLGRCVQPEEVADQVAFLLGPSGCITGQRLVICAGASL